MNNDVESNKILRGQFFTTENPFNHNLFFEWYDLIKDVESEVFIEPFGGSNNIIKMISNINLKQPKSWMSFDIDPPNYNSTPEYIVEKKDTLKEFPKGFNVGITNPPYLAKNSASRRGLSFPDTEFDDLYKLSLHKMLINLKYVAAIIPESFITQDRFKGRLYGVISLNQQMFEDTSVPVCLALFVPELQEDYHIYRGDIRLGYYTEIEDELKLLTLKDKNSSKKWTFNNPKGPIGIKTIDSTIEEDIGFVLGNDINPEKIKVSSRSLTRVSGVEMSKSELNEFIEICNSILANYREKTQDVFMTSFKGLREDKKYRRRLSFAEARSIMNKAYEEINKKKV